MLGRAELHPQVEAAAVGRGLGNGGQVNALSEDFNGQTNR